MPVSTADTLLTNKIFGVALEKKATDIHLLSGNYPVLRIDNKLYSMADEAVLTVDVIAGLMDSFLTPEEQQRLTVERDVKTTYTWASRARFRATVYYQKGYPAISLRLIPAAIPTPQELKIPDIIIAKISTARGGLLIITGPFNSGRSTTVASLLNLVNTTQSKRIVSIERPIEYILVNAKSVVDQREVGKDTPSFVQGLLDVKGDDVDVVGLGDMSEPGIEEHVLTVAESGRLVIAHMEANSVISTLEKFIDSVPKDRRHWAKHSLSQSLLAVMNQRLVAAVGGGRVLAASVLTMTPAVASIIQEENFAQLTNVMQTGRDDGMISLDLRLAELARAGTISAEDAKNVALDPSSFRV